MNNRQKIESPTIRVKLFDHVEHRYTGIIYKRKIEMAKMRSALLRIQRRDASLIDKIKRRCSLYVAKLTKLSNRTTNICAGQKPRLQFES
jgi:hypothetical protein